MVGAKLARDKLSDGADRERAFRLYKEEAVPDGIRRIARGQLDSAAEELEELRAGSWAKPFTTPGSD